VDFRGVTTAFDPAFRSSHAVVIRDARDVVLKNLHLSGTPCSGILVLRSKDIYVSNCNLTDTNGCPVTLLGNSERLLVRGNRMKGFTYAGIHVQGAVTHSVIENNEVSGGTGTYNGHPGIFIGDRRINLPRADDFSGRKPWPLYHYAVEKVEDRLNGPMVNFIVSNVSADNKGSGIYSDGAVLNFYAYNRIKNNGKEGACLDFGSTGNVFFQNEITVNGRRAGYSDGELRNDYVLEHGRMPDGTAKAKVPGLSLDYALLNIVFHNTLRGNYGGGIKCVRSCFCSFLGKNVIVDNNRGKNDRFHFFGVELGAAPAEEERHEADIRPSVGNRVIKNTIRGNHYAGIFFGDGCVLNEAHGNRIQGTSPFALESVRKQENYVSKNISKAPSMNVAESGGARRAFFSQTGAHAPQNRRTSTAGTHVKSGGSMKKQVYIHIGYLKTGTTAIQRYFGKHHSGPVRSEILYPRSGRPHTPPAHHDLALSFIREAGMILPLWFSTRADIMQTTSKELWNRLAREIDEAKQTKVFISSEELIRFGGSEKTCASIARIREYLDPHEVKVICYIRRQDDYYESFYNTTVTEVLEQKPIQECMQNYEKIHFNYLAALDPWEEIFGRENMIVRLYDSELVSGGIVPDILGVMEVSEGFVEPITASQIVNPSTDNRYVEIKRWLNHFNTGSPRARLEQNQKIRKVFQALDTIERSNRSSDCRLLCFDERMEMMKRNEHINRTLSERYFGGKWPLFRQIEEEERKLPVAVTPASEDILQVILGMVACIYLNNNGSIGNDALLQRVRELENSRSWRITAPLRKLSSLCKKLTGKS